MSSNRIVAFALGLVALGFACLSQAQVPMTGAGKGAPGGGFTPSCTQSTNFLARATNVTSNTDKQNYDNLLCGLETDSVGCSNTLDALYVLAAVDRTTAVLNLCSSSFALVENGSVSFSAYHGYTGDGSSFYLDTQWAPNAGGTFYGQDSGSALVYILTSRTSGSSMMALGTTSTGSNYLYIRALNGSNNADFEVNDNTFPSGANSNAQGQYVASRTTSLQVDLYKNSSTSALASSPADLATTPSSHTLTLFADNDTSSVIVFTTDQQSAAGFGRGLTSAESKKVADRVNTYMTAYGINKY